MNTKKILFSVSVLLAFASTGYAQSIGVGTGYVSHNGTQGVRTDITFSHPLLQYLDLTTRLTSTSGLGRVTTYTSYPFGAVRGTQVDAGQTLFTNSLELGVSAGCDMGARFGLGVSALAGIGRVTCTQYFGDENAYGTLVYPVFCADVVGSCYWRPVERLQLGLYVDLGVLLQNSYGTDYFTEGVGVSAAVKF